MNTNSSLDTDLVREKRNYRVFCDMGGEKFLCSSASSSFKLFLFVVPLILISGFVGSRTNLLFTSSYNYYPWISSSVSISPALSPSSTDNGSSNFDWNSTLVSITSPPPSPTSPPPPLSVEEMTGAPPPVENFSNNLSNVAPSPVISDSSRKWSEIELIEAGLARVRSSVMEAKNSSYKNVQDPDFIPKGPMYWNANAFLKSYQEMEKQFKIFVYEEGQIPIFHNGPCGSIYAMEGNFINNMEVSKFRTRNPEKAQAFFLPFSVASIVHFVYEPNSHNWAPLKRLVKDYGHFIATKHPHWNRSRGADHFMLACHDWGPELSKSYPGMFENSIRALCNANTSEGFKPIKDVSIPEINLPGGKIDRLLGGPSPSKRPILVFFAGGVHGPVRPILLEHWENKDPDVQVYRYLKKGISYHDMLRKSRFCICASGYEVASPRMVEALYTGCVPVIIKDNYVAPFSDVLNWNAFSVEIPVKDIPNLKNILMGISQRRYIRLQTRGVQVRRHFIVNVPPKRFDVFHMTLHSIWLRRLNVRVQDM
ncbi:probable glycosyltransferase At5g03795 [Impatiens glandulifera]|uniref:probable glycosyltransferase At5g03795 n=1 Tax=Impatiens glandulifera TaxID=253017 RepID=UPI001FB0767E|nr:probable glycosyltransferase At5g03795 [Impatiens glandulifera]